MVTFFERRAGDLLAVGAGVGGADRLVGRLVVGAEAPLALDLEGQPCVLGERDPADHRSFVVVGLAVDGRGRADQGAVKGRDLDEPVCRVDAEVDLSLLVVNVVRVAVEFALPAGGSQHLAVDKDHVVVETVQRRPRALAVPLPPAERSGRKECFPRRPPDVAGQGPPLGRHARALEHGSLTGIRLHRDPLVEPQAAGPIEATAKDDRVTSHHRGDSRLQGRRLFQARSGRLLPAVRRDVIDMVRPGRHLIVLLDRAIRPARGLRRTSDPKSTRAVKAQMSHADGYLCCRRWFIAAPFRCL